MSDAARPPCPDGLIAVVWDSATAPLGFFKRCIIHEPLILRRVFWFLKQAPDVLFVIYSSLLTVLYSLFVHIYEIEENEEYDNIFFSLLNPQTCRYTFSLHLYFVFQRNTLCVQSWGISYQ